MDNTILYRIRAWGKNFENNRTRELRRMEFVLLPNRMDGDGYTELVDHEDGAAHFGAWCALVQVASKCEPRGELIRSNGKPHTPDSLERLTRIPAKVFVAVLPRLVEIGWLDAAQIPQDVGTIPHPPAGSCGAYAGAHAVERNGMERNGTEESSSSKETVTVIPKRPTTTKYPPEAVAWVKEALSDYQGGEWGQPDDGICLQILDSMRGSPLESLRELLLLKLKSGQKPGKSWAWFVQVVRTHYGGGNGDTAAIA